MKKITIILTLLLVCGLQSFGREHTEAQIRFRTTIYNYLRSEGFAPEIDSDGDIAFKKEGVPFWIAVGGESPFYIEFSRSSLNFDDDDDMNKIMESINETHNLLRCVKCIKRKNHIRIVVEMFTRSAEDFEVSLYSCISVLNSANKALKDFYSEESNTDVSNSNSGSSQTNSSSLTVDGKTLVNKTFPARGGTEVFIIQANGNWETWGVPTWCTIVNRTSTTFTLKCNANTSSSRRSDYMKVLSDGKEVRINIEQEGR